MVNRDECIYLPKPPLCKKAVYQDGCFSQSQQFALSTKVSSAQNKFPKIPGSNHSPSVDVFSSPLHQDVSACLHYLAIKHENGVPAGPFLLDIVATNFEFPDHRIIYELDTEKDFYLGTQMLTAEKRFRHKMLERLAYNGIHIKQTDWQILSPAHRAQHLLELQTKQGGPRMEAKAGENKGPDTEDAVKSSRPLP